jgi:hypothetical protein
MKEIASLSGLDPNQVIQPPQPEAPPKPNISLRLNGAEDMTNPLMLAFMITTDLAPSPEQIEQAKQLISMVVVPAPPPPPPVLETGPDGSTKAVAAPQAESKAPALEGMQITLQPAVPGGMQPGMGLDPMDQGMVGPDGQPLPQAPPLPNSEVPPSPSQPPAVGEANPKWGLMPHVSQRAEGPGEGGTQ